MDTDVLEGLKAQVLSVEPGDTVVLSSPNPISPERASQIKEQAERRLVPKGVRVVVMDSGLHVDSVIREEG